MEGLLVRRSPVRFQLEHLEDRLTPSGQGLLGGAAPIHSDTLVVDWSSRVNVTILNFTPTYQTLDVVQVDFRVDMSVFSLLEFQVQPSAFSPSTGAFGSDTGAFGTGFQNDSSLTQNVSMASFAANSTASSSQAASLNHQPSSSGTPSQSHPPTQVTFGIAPTQVANPVTTTVQTSQANNAVISFVAGSQLRALSTTASGAADSGASESLRLFPLQGTDLGAPAVNPQSILNPIPTPSPKLTPLPPSGGGNIDKPEEQAKPPAVVPPPVEQQELQELEELGGAGLAAAFVPDNTDDAAASLALVGVSDSPSAASELQVLLFGIVAASVIGVAHSRNRTKESEREMLEAANWLPRPLTQ
jgi:hypothetical protein